MAFFSRRQLLKSAAVSACLPTMWHVRSESLYAADDAPKRESKTAVTEPKPDPYADAKFVAGAPPLPAKDSFSIVVLPDTQHYSQRFPSNFHDQTEWIVANTKNRRIAAVLHLGDITHRSTRPEWEVARSAMCRLDGHVPYFIIPGNHDYSDGKSLCVDRTTLFNEYFPLNKFQDNPTFGGTFDHEPERFENSFHTFSAGGRDFLVIAL